MRLKGSEKQIWVRTSGKWLLSWKKNSAVKMSSCFDFVTYEEKKFIKQEDRNILVFHLHLHLLYTYTK